MPIFHAFWNVPRGLVLCAALSAASCTQPSSTGAERPLSSGAIAAPFPGSFAPLVRKVLPAVVNIAVRETVTAGNLLDELPPELRDTPLGREFRRRFGSHKESVMGAGSGFIIDPSGIIVTNNHVVGNATRITVSVQDGEQLPAKVIGTDELTDVAVIRVQARHPLPAVPWGDSKDVHVGDWVLTAGNPFGLGGTVSAGIISARGRELGAGPFDQFLQLDAAINPGNSGGPAFNLQGQVIGMTTAIVSPTGGSVGIGFAIPSDLVHRIVQQELQDRGPIPRGWLGVSVETRETQGPAAHRGVLIAGVERNGPAARAGIRSGDIVMSVNGEAVNTSLGLVRAIAERAPGADVKLEIVRGGRTVSVPVVVGRRPAETSE